MASIIGLIGTPGRPITRQQGRAHSIHEVHSQRTGFKNINVNAIAPGFIQTDMTSVLPENVKNDVKAHSIE
jgi:3-oxoacyl-[acyl-carrier protein] reductase